MALNANTLWTAPLMRHVDMSYHTQLFNGSLMKINVFRSDAGAEADAAWESLGVDCM